MKKTSVYLMEAEVERLRWLARRERASQALIIRKAIAAYVPDGPGDRRFELFSSGEGPGTSIAEIPEEELLEG
jgi:hypothetical protein